MLRLATLLAYLGCVQTMTQITRQLLTPLPEAGEACGYESCRSPIEGQLNIHVIPHTHAELGYTRTFDQHFTGRDEIFDKSNINMKRILDYVISELWARKERTFTFSDLPYLYRWWSVRDETVHRMVYQLFRQGRLHIVGGGWSMTDESTATYQPIIDQFTYALRKLNATFLDCARPYVTWQSDVFGHTGEFASLMAQMGFDGHFINPISYDDELLRMRNKKLEFIWRGSPDLGVSSEIFTHKLFDGYWAPPGFCFGGQCNDPLIVNSNSAFDNIKERVKLFVEAMQYRQSPHYATNHLVVMMGQRMGYYDAPLWFENIEKLMWAVNQYSTSNNLKMFMYYSTPACYLRAIFETNATFPVESGDFVPIAYDKNTHFSGIFTSRPSFKYIAREGNLYLQITKQLHVLARLMNNGKFFEDFHWIMGVFQDHNVLTGGMRPHVRDYYVNKIHKSLRASERIIGNGLINNWTTNVWAKEGRNNNRNLMNTPSTTGYGKCLFNISYCEYTNKDKYYIVVYNPLAWNVTIPVRLPVAEGRFTVFLPDLTMVPSVIMKIPQCIKDIPYNRANEVDYELVFIAENVPALGYRSYFIEKVTRRRRSVDSNDHVTEEIEKNDEFSDLSNQSTVKNDEIGNSDSVFNNNGVEIDEIDHLDDLFNDNGVKIDKFGNGRDAFTNNKFKNGHNVTMMKRPIEFIDLFSNGNGKNYDIDTIDIDLSNVNDENGFRQFIISRKIQYGHNKDNLTYERGKNDKSHLIGNDRQKNYETVHLHDVNLFLNNSNKNVYGRQGNSDFKKPNVTKTITFNKKSEPNNDLKRIFDSKHDEDDNIELQIVYERARKKQKLNANNFKTNKNNSTLNFNAPSGNLETKYGVSEKIHDDNVTEFFVDIIKEHDSIKNNSDYSNKDLLNYTNTVKNEYVKNENEIVLKEHNTQNDSDCSNKDLMAKTNLNIKKYLRNEKKCIYKGPNTKNKCKLKGHYTRKTNSEYSNQDSLEKYDIDENVRNANKSILKGHNTEKNDSDNLKKDLFKKTDIYNKKHIKNANKRILKEANTQKIDSDHSNTILFKKTDTDSKKDIKNANKRILKGRNSQEKDSNHSIKDLLEKPDSGNKKDVKNAFKKRSKGHNTENNNSDHLNKDLLEKLDIDNKKDVTNANKSILKGYNTEKNDSDHFKKDLFNETDIYNKKYVKNTNKRILKGPNTKKIDSDNSNKDFLKKTDVGYKKDVTNVNKRMLKGHTTQENDSDHSNKDSLEKTDIENKKHVKNSNIRLLKEYNIQENDSEYSKKDLLKETYFYSQDHGKNKNKSILKEHNTINNDLKYSNKYLVKITNVVNKQHTKNKNNNLLKGYNTQINNSNTSNIDILFENSIVDNKEYVRNENKMVLERFNSPISESDYLSNDLKNTIVEKQVNVKNEDKTLLEGYYTPINDSDYLNKYFENTTVDKKEYYFVKIKNKMASEGHFTPNHSVFLNKDLSKDIDIEKKESVKNKMLNKIILKRHNNRINDTDNLNKDLLENSIIDTTKDVKLVNESVLKVNSTKKKYSDNSHKDLLEKTDIDNKKHVKHVNERILRGHNSQENDSDHSNKYLLENSRINLIKYVKNANKNKLQELKRCNCKKGKLKKDRLKKNSKQYTFDQTFDNETFKFTHFKQDGTTKIPLTKGYKREIKDLKQIDSDHQFLNLDVKGHQDNKENKLTNPKSNKIKYLQHKIKKLREQLKKLTNNTNAEQKKKHFIRQISYIRSDGESLIDNYHHYDDDEYYGDIVDSENVTDEPATKENDYSMTYHHLSSVPTTTQSSTRRTTQSTTQRTTQTTTKTKTTQNTTPYTVQKTKQRTLFYASDLESAIEKSYQSATESAPRSVNENTIQSAPQSTTQCVTKHTTQPAMRSSTKTYVPLITRTTQSSAREATESTTTENLLLSELYSDTTDTYICNEYVNITTDMNKNITFVALANGLTMALNINFYYYASDDPVKMGKPDLKKPGAYVFRPMDPEPVFIAQKSKLEVYKSSEVEEIHSNTEFASFVIRLYKSMPYFEVQWILSEIPVSDEIGKDVFIRYQTDLETHGMFYTDANGRQTVRRIRGLRPNYTPAMPDDIAGNFYPVTSKITIEDPRRMIRFSVFNDRTQAGTSSHGEIDLMLNRRILTDDAGIQAYLNETENEKGTTITGKHYIYLTKLSTKVNKIFEKKLAKEIDLKPQVFVAKRNAKRSIWTHYNNEFSGVKQRVPIGLHILTLQEWNDGTFLVRIENYLEKSDVIQTGIKKIILKDLFTVFRIKRVKETTLAGNILMENFQPLNWRKSGGNTDKLDPFVEVKVDAEIYFKPQQIRTFIVWVQFHK